MFIPRVQIHSEKDDSRLHKGAACNGRCDECSLQQSPDEDDCKAVLAGVSYPITFIGILTSEQISETSTLVLVHKFLLAFIHVIHFVSFLPQVSADEPFIDITPTKTVGHDINALPTPSLPESLIENPWPWI